MIYARRAEAGQERDGVRRAALEAVQAAEGPDTATDGEEQDVLNWLEAELREVWTRAEGSREEETTDVQKRRRG